MKKPKIKTQWDLTLLYASPKDPAIEKDVSTIEQAFTKFAKKYRTGTFTQKVPTLLVALRDYEKLLEATIAKPLIYFFCAKEIDADDTCADAQLRLISERLTKASQQVTFFELALGKIEKAMQKQYLKEKKLEHFHYYLERIFNTAQHDLSEAEERIVSLLSAPARSMWVDGVESVVSRLTIKHRGKDLPLSEAVAEAVKITNVKARRALWKKAALKLQEAADFSEQEINAVYTSKKITDELRHYPKPYSSTLDAFENDEATLDALLNTLESTLRVPHAFFAAKKDLLQLKDFEMIDANANIANPKTSYTFNDAVRIVSDTFTSIEPRYAELLNTFLKEGNIDVFPRKGKRGGGFQLDTFGLPTFIFLNLTDDIDSITTLGHEMGHAIHSQEASAQGVLYEGAAISVAEVASTFFEELVLQTLIKQLPPKEALLVEHNALLNTLGNVYMTFARHTFELALHERIRSEGFVPKQEIATLYRTEQQRFYGPAVILPEEAGYGFIRIGHFRRHFYHYPYAFGKLISLALVRRYLEDPAALKEAQFFMRAGRSMSPKDIFAQVGIDVQKEMFWKEGVAAIEDAVQQFSRRCKDA